MVAPFPPEAAPGGTAYNQRAVQVLRFYTDAARLSNDIVNVDAEVDLVKVAQLAFVIAPQLDAQANDAAVEFRAAVERQAGNAGLEWATRNAMVADLNAIRLELNTFRTWVITNLSAALTPATVTYSAASTVVSAVPTTLAKPHPVVTEVKKIRDLYALGS